MLSTQSRYAGVDAMTATGRPHWHVETEWFVFVYYIRHDAEGRQTVKIRTFAGIIPYWIEIDF